ncbi:MAG: helix-turn-helix transcriptional regulator [Candidatus Binataceae bacterium]|nr:helix-turn-helix transcriptional regulator [Candidatus Binataceae bacterium]
MRPDRLRGSELLAASFGSRPTVSSEGYGWRDLSVCSWRVNVDRFDLIDLPDMLVSLHTEGPVYRRSGGGWGPDRSMPGQVTVMPPGSSATFRRGGILGVTTVDLPRERLESLLGARDAKNWLASLRMRLGFVDPLISSMVSALAEELRSPSERGSLYADSLADSLTLHLFRLNGHTRDLTPTHGELAGGALQRVRDRIEADLGKELSLRALADEARLSRYHFSRAFRAATGLPPHRYLTERRLERAKVLLRATEMPIIEIALDVGFSSQAHLTDCFHRFIGVTPGEFRRRR